MVLASGALAATRAVYCHSLRRVLDPAGGAQAPMGAQRVVRLAVGRAGAADARRIPGQYGIEQAHAPLVGNVLLDPGMV
jgi:hypothetical protein